MKTSCDAAPARRLPIGAETQPGGGVHFRVWAPDARTLDVEIESQAPRALRREDDGYFAGFVEEAASGTRYRLRLDGERALPDPASRFQPEGPHGPSEVVDPDAFAWSDGAWRGLPRHRLVMYEMHVGTFTDEGSWAAAADRLPALAELGITCIEMMPVADFSGRFGWGYDGVDLYAPCRLYGQPDDLRRFIDRAHGLGIAVILDVVYNHLGPDGNYLTAFSRGYMTDRYANEWGEALNFDGPQSGPVREFFIANAGYWIDEFHFDGLRLDATQQIFDASDEHLLTAIGRRVREAAGGRHTFIAAENETQTAQLVRPVEAGGYGLDALWNDDFHHAALVALTGHREAYYSDYHGRPGEFIAAAKYGFLYQGQFYAWQKQRRGTPTLDIPAAQFVTYLENHDQIANSAAGRHTYQMSSPGTWRALTAVFLLSPGLPLLFQGQEFCTSAPFLYFADHQGELSGLVKKGRSEFLVQFPSLAGADAQAALADPGEEATFRRCVLDHGERERHQTAVALHRDLLALRRELYDAGPRVLDGAPLAEHAWVLRFFGDDDRQRLLIVNLGIDLRLPSIPEPLVAPLAGHSWQLAWSSEAPAYGGSGVAAAFDESGAWRIPGHAAVLFAPGPPPPPPVNAEQRRTA